MKKQNKFPEFIEVENLQSNCDCVNTSLEKSSAPRAVKTSLFKRNSFTKSLPLLVVVVILISSLSACKTKNTDTESEVYSVETTSSNTVSIYYKDDASSNEGHSDIITDNYESKDQNSASDNLAEDADPQLIIPSDKNKTESEIDGVSSEDISHIDEESSVSQTSESKDNTDDNDTLSGVMDSSTNSSNAESNGNENDASSKNSSTSSTNSYDKSYTKPY